ncbi:MAG TPA: prepilin-type N-terminal cleavage/methylation domain-containing protein [Geminicoccus sp.]|jgi:prepilin-type N-terminal cleavage/methylation domain-containing protein|uniref:prepilin-type N-terminal cleavage/methylation domain-containing protein n=1 Tax=Geminicoccus sp. TaxID=2024832 RepID=UPI002E34B5BB|nr:prepilin-type N-terminal cleavage/methylation domain-containing protein [Geminicoccus sp.]HEX2529771.1 prepilin-type N-terminal cleavage/methylation domain-containing protein [Geminicoccus sp.]
MRADHHVAGRPRAPIDTAGFTILEVLVALTVLGLVVAVLFEGIASGLRRTSYEEAQLALVLEAERIMARIDLDLGGGVAVQDGTDGNLRWRLERREVPTEPEDEDPPEIGEDAGEDADDAGKVVLVDYEVTVEGPDGRTLTVGTRRVRTAEGNADAAR